MRAAGVHVLNCPACGKGPLKRETRRIPLTCRGTTIEVDQPGDWCPACGEGVLSAADMAATKKARRDLIARAEGLRRSRLGHDSGHDRHAKRGTPTAMTKPKSKRKPKGLAQLQQVPRKHRVHPEVGREQAVYYARLEASQVKELKRLAREHGTTLAQELENAIDAYCLGVSRVDIPWLTQFFQRFNAAIDRNNRTLDETLRMIDKSNVRLARLKRFRLKLPR